MSSTAVASFSASDPSATTDAPPPSVTPAGAPPLFTPDTGGRQPSWRSPATGLLSGLAAHRQAGTPFLIGIFGSAGSGKTSLIRQILAAVGASGNAAADHQSLRRIAAVRVDASTGRDPAATLVSRVFGALSTAYPTLAEDAVFAGGDPVKAARAAGERVDELRRKLDAERQALDEIGGRRAQLVDTVLFNAPGSRVDVYARANRSRIEGRLRAFGIAAADPIATYKDLVREATENGGGTSRLGLALRALWGFKGQGALLMLAILLLVFGWGCGALAARQDAWVAWLTGLGDRFAGLTNWAQGHADWLMPLSHAAFALAALAVLFDIVRAIRFLQPVLRGVSLLSGDLDGRRRDLDGLLAHQTRRVDHLASEVDSAVRSADAAERRVESRKASGLLETGPALTSEFSTPASPHDAADTFFAGLSAAMDAPTESPTEAPAAPERIVVAIDELDRLTPQAAAAYLETAQKLLGRPHFVTLAAVDRGHVLAGFSETDPAFAAAQVSRCVQLSYDLDAEAAARQALGTQPSEPENSGLDRPWQEFESRLVDALTPFAGPNPRNIKRFVNSYRVARADARLADATAAELAGLASALALDGNGAAAELGAYTDAHGSLDAAPGGDLGQALAAAQHAVGATFGPAEAYRGFWVARIYSRRG